MPSYIGLDFETYSDVDLPTHGLARYLESPHFQVLLASVFYEDAYSVPVRQTVDFTVHALGGVNGARQQLQSLLGNANIVAHNAGFEWAVLRRIGIDVPAEKMIDSAVIAACFGADRHLEMAGPQLLGFDKMDEGKDLIKLFAVRQKDQESPAFDVQLKLNNPGKWDTFIEYCERDAELGFKIAKLVDFGQSDVGLYTSKEQRYSRLTMRMNDVGWPVDVTNVEWMNKYYQRNLEHLERDFRASTGAQDLNLNSHKQLKEWCENRGFKAVSFDEAHVTKYLKAIEQRRSKQGLTNGQLQVKKLLELKQALGGSSLKKLQTILDTVCDRRLKDQYVHCGAIASFRTTGRAVQMQNLTRLGRVVEPSSWYELTNPELAENLRQVFGGEQHKRLIVGDFASVESRGLAWYAGAEWKLDAYRHGKDMYKVLGAQMFGVHYDDIDKSSLERRAGKVGELSCGYQAGPTAVQKFADGMGISMNEAEAADLVWKWRSTNPEIVQFWSVLQEGLESIYALRSSTWSHTLPQEGYTLRMHRVQAPQSLRNQTGGTAVYSLHVSLWYHGTQILRRVFHGINTQGRELCYFKPTSRKTGDLWARGYVDPKTKQWRNYSIYGGKMAGILTQSLCREIFFEVLDKLCLRLRNEQNVQVVGQFHDEIVLEWDGLADGAQLITIESVLKQEMSKTSIQGVPLAAEVQSAARYIK